MTVMTLGFGLFIDLEPTANWTKIILFQIVAGIGVGPNFQSPLISPAERRRSARYCLRDRHLRLRCQLATSISVVIGGVVFQNGMQKQYGELVAQLGPDIAGLLSGGNAPRASAPWRLCLATLVPSRSSILDESEDHVYHVRSLCRRLAS